MNKKYCDFCNKEIKGTPYAFKLYQGIFSNDFLIVKEICEDCNYKIKQFIKKL
jgi:hypothetical protein